MNIIKKVFEHPKYGEVLRFLVGGFLTTVVNFLIYTPCYYFVFQPIMLEETASIVCNALAWAGAVVFAFFVNKYLVFRSKTSKHAGFMQFVAFVATRAVSGVMEIFFPAVLIFFGVNNLVAKLIVSFFILICNYLTGKFFAFRRRADMAERIKAKSKP